MAESETSREKNKRPPPTPRIPLLDEAAQQQIYAVVALGSSRQTAADYVGCRYDSLRATVRRSPRFAEMLRKAEAVSEVSALGQLNKASKDERNWRAVLWFLERRFPDRYGRRKPNTTSPREMAEVIDRFVEIVAAEVSVPHDRRKIEQRLQAVVEQLTTPAP